MFASTFVVVSRSPTLYAPAPLTGFQTSVTDVPLSTAQAAGDDSTGVPGAAPCTVKVRFAARFGQFVVLSPPANVLHEATSQAYPCPWVTLATQLVPV